MKNFPSRLAALVALPLGLWLAAPAASLAWTSEQDAAQDELQQLFAENGIHLDLNQGICAIDATVAVREELLEYFLVASHGAAHESMLITGSNPSVINTALLALGVEPGTNAVWGPKNPQPSEEELRAGVSPYEVEPPSGDGFYLYVTWQDGEETYFYRAEDLVRNLSTGRSMKRHRWVYLGSRMIEWEKPDEERFAAEMLGNLINIAYFEQGDTMLTGALPECVEQAIWMANAWLLPDRGHEVRLVFSQKRLGAVPSGLFEAEPPAGR